MIVIASDLVNRCDIARSPSQVSERRTIASILTSEFEDFNTSEILGLEILQKS